MPTWGRESWWRTLVKVGVVPLVGKGGQEGVGVVKKKITKGGTGRKRFKKEETVM